jgi:hypothetical protein
MAVLLALVFALVFVGDSLHLALFEHEQCVEHGELVHVHGDSEGHAHAHEDGQVHEHSHAAPEPSLALSVTEGRSELEHDHCALLLATQDDRIEPVEHAFSVQGVLEFRGHFWSRSEAPTLPQIALIHRAPKVAPPV